LSSARAESTRATLEATGLTMDRVARIEGVADRNPFVPQNRYDPRNRRISITLAWREARAAAPAAQPQPPPPGH
jgi:chemotaxis protein MotB